MNNVAKALHQAVEAINAASYDPKKLEVAEVAICEALIRVKELIAERDALRCPKCQAMMTKGDQVTLLNRTRQCH